MSDFIEKITNDDGVDRRGFLKCMAWAGTGVIWSINGGLLTSTVLGQEANKRSAIASAELNFVQISDSHIGFNKPANTDVVGTFRETIMRINALPKTPEFLLHTGDLTHLSDPAQFDTLGQVLKECRTKDVFYVPGEHDTRSFPRPGWLHTFFGAPLGIVLGTVNRRRAPERPGEPKFSLSRAIVVGGLAGIVGGWAFGQWMAKVNHFPLIAGLIHLSSRNAGVALHFVFAFIIGASFGLLFQRDVRGYGFPGMG